MSIFLLMMALLNSFALKWNIPKGTNHCSGRVCIGDTDRDGNYELIFRPHTYGIQCFYFCELIPPNVWQIDSINLSIWGLPWELGDFDHDGFYDLLVVGGIVVPPVLPSLALLNLPIRFRTPLKKSGGTLCVIP